jgi:hypothetical protein
MALLKFSGTKDPLQNLAVLSPSPKNYPNLHIPLTLLAVPFKVRIFKTTKRAQNVQSRV